MSNRAVIGLGFGDEGKGVATEYLCSQDPENTIVVRFSGGHQCGHKVIKGTTEHVFSNFGSGTLSGCPTYWSEYCTFEPIGFWTEYQLLRKKGVEPRIIIHPDCPVTTPYDMLACQNGIEREHGTTGTGFFRTKNRHFNDGLQFTFEQLLIHPITHKLDEIKEYFGYEDINLDAFYQAWGSIKNLMVAGVITMSKTVPDYKHRVFEGSQGLMLDEHIGYMPHCTPSDITPRNIFQMGFELDEILLVTRAYQTRHGNGPMTNEVYDLELMNTSRETNNSEGFQGAFRTSMLDLDLLKHAKRKGIDKVSPDTKASLLVTCMDQLLIYQVTYSPKGAFGSRDQKAFACFLSTSLGINGDLYINTSPYSTSVEKI